MKGFAIDHQNQLLREGNRIIPLAQKEFDLFLFLMGNPGRIISATELYQKVWCTGKPDAANSVAVYIARLRHKLEESQFVGRIETDVYKRQLYFLSRFWYNGRNLSKEEQSICF